MIKQTSDRGNTPVAFILIVLFIIAPPLAIIAGIALAIYNKGKKKAADRPRTGASRPV